MNLTRELVVLDTEFDPLGSLDGHVCNAFVVELLAFTEDFYVGLLVLKFERLKLRFLQLILHGLEHA